MKNIIIYLLLSSMLLTLSGCNSTTKMGLSDEKQQNVVQPSNTDAQEESEKEPPLWVNNLRPLIISHRFYSDVIETETEVFYVSNTGINCYDKIKKTDRKLVEDQVDGMHVYNDSLYFFTDVAIKQLQEDESVKEILKCPLDSEENSDFYLEDIAGFFFYQDELYIYYTNISVLKVDLKTMKTTDFLLDVDDMAFLEDICYYVEHGAKTFSIYELDLTTNERKLVRGEGTYKPDDKYDAVVVVNNTLYYSKRDPWVIYRHEKNGKDVPIVNANMLFSINPFFKKDCFYYSKKTADEKYELYEYNAVRDEHRLLATSKDCFIDLLITDYSIIYRESKNAPFTHLYY